MGLRVNNELVYALDEHQCLHLVRCGAPVRVRDVCHHKQQGRNVVWDVSAGDRQVHIRLLLSAERVSLDTSPVTLMLNVCPPPEPTAAAMRPRPCMMAGKSVIIMRQPSAASARTLMSGPSALGQYLASPSFLILYAGGFSVWTMLYPAHLFKN